jgi:hypothetical protein
MNEVCLSHTGTALPVHGPTTRTGTSGDGVGDQFDHRSPALVGGAVRARCSHHNRRTCVAGADLAPLKRGPSHEAQCAPRERDGLVQPAAAHRAVWQGQGDDQRAHLCGRRTRPDRNGSVIPNSSKRGRSQGKPIPAMGRRPRPASMLRKSRGKKNVGS